jgi:hypothetical protein
MERRHEEVAGSAGAITGEDAARAIGAVRRRSEPHDEEACARIAEAGDRPGPVGVAAIGPSLLDGDAAAISPQARTAFTRRDLLVDDGEAWCRRGCGADGRSAHRTQPTL